MRENRLDPRKAQAALALSLVLVATATGCSRDLPNRTQADTDSAQGQTAAATSAAPTVTVTATVDKTLPPDVASLSLSIPTNPPKPADGEPDPHEPQDVVDMLIDQGATEDQITTTESGQDTIISVSSLGIRDAARSQREAEALGAKVVEISYDVSDPSAIKKDAVIEAKAKADADAAMIVEALSDGSHKAGSMTDIEIEPIETIAQDESGVTVRVTVRATYPIS